MSSNRPNWHEYFIEMAFVAAKRSTCNRLQVGCVLVRSETVLATGFNGAARGLPHCTAESCNATVTSGCKNTVHAEANAIAQAARHGHAVDACTAYVTDLPCVDCFRLLVNAGVERVVYARPYRITTSVELARDLGIPIEHVPHVDSAAQERPPLRSEPPPRAA